MSIGSGAADRRKWNQRYAEAGSLERPAPHPLVLRWRERMAGGPMLDAACGLGRGLAGALERCQPCYAVDVSDVAIRRARRLWPSPAIRWVVADVTALHWPPAFLALACSLGFTDVPFLVRLRAALRPGGLLLYEGFARRQLAEHPRLNPDWTTTAERMRSLFGDWTILECQESAEPPYLVSFAGMRPARA